MKLIELNLVEFSEMVDSDKPVPGGGSVAAYVSNLGAGLARMLGHLTINKKRFLELDENAQEQFKNAFTGLSEGHTRLLSLVDEDTESYAKVMECFKMPKETDEEKAARSKAIQETTFDAMLVPFEAAQVAFNCLKVTEGLVEHGNANAISDLASGMYLLEAGMNCSILNVKINASGLKDQDSAYKYLEDCTKMQKEAKDILNKNLNIIQELL